MTFLGEKAGTNRLAWPDTTRALGVVAVVLFHALIWNHEGIGEGQSALSSLWEKVDLILGRIRMPVLFALSGLLAASGIFRGWTQGTALHRLAENFYLYALWAAIYFAFFIALDRPNFPHSIDSLPEFASQFVIPGTTLWFVFSLAVYPPAVVLLRYLRVPAWGVVFAALALWAVGTFFEMPGFAGKVLSNFLFFALGVFASAALKRIAQSGWLGTVGYLSSFALLAVVGSLLPSPVNHFAILASSVMAVPAAVAAVGRLSDFGVVAKAGHFIGKRTLSIYLLHVPLLGIASLFSNADSAWSVALVSHPVGDAIYPVFLTAIVVAACILGDRLLKCFPGNVLLRRPEFEPRGRHRANVC